MSCQRHSVVKFIEVETDTTKKMYMYKYKYSISKGLRSDLSICKSSNTVSIVLLSTQYQYTVLSIKQY